MCKSNDVLEIDILIGADNLWTFHISHIPFGLVQLPTLQKMVILMRKSVRWGVGNRTCF